MIICECDGDDTTPDGDSKAGLASLIPELYFDLIARFVPGSILLLGLGFGVPGVRATMAEVAGGVGDRHLGAAAIVGLCIMAWVMGVMLSVPFFILDWLCNKPKWTCPIHILLGDGGNSLHPTLKGDVIRKITVLSSETPQVKDLEVDECRRIPFHLLLDYVRGRADRSLGSIVVKIYAEETCFGSLTTAFLLIGIEWWKLHVNGDPLVFWVPLVMAAVAFVVYFVGFRMARWQRTLLGLSWQDRHSVRNGQYAAGANDQDPQNVTVNDGQN